MNHKDEILWQLGGCLGLIVAIGIGHIVLYDVMYDIRKCMTHQHLK